MKTLISLVDSTSHLKNFPFIAKGMKQWYLSFRRVAFGKNIIVVLFFVGIFLSRCGSPSSSSEVDSQGEKTSPNDGSTECVDGSFLQSPINILTKWTKEGRHDVSFNVDGRIEKVANLGHTVQLDFVPGSRITKDGKTYLFDQLHFHTPSEHHVDGISFPLEMHVVSSREEGGATEYLVMAMLFKMGDENKFLKEFIDRIPEEAHHENKLPEGMADFSDLFDAEMSNELANCYHYDGSLTTPPYTESVHWYISSKVWEALPDQIERIEQIEGNNARVVQPLQNRVIQRE